MSRNSCLLTSMAVLLAALSVGSRHGSAALPDFAGPVLLAPNPAYQNRFLVDEPKITPVKPATPSLGDPGEVLEPQQDDSTQESAETTQVDEPPNTTDKNNDTDGPAADSFHLENDAEATEMPGDSTENDSVENDDAGNAETPEITPPADDSNDTPDEGNAKSEPELEPLPELTPAQATLRDQVRRTLLAYYQRGLNPREYTATDIMELCWAFGCATEVGRHEGSGTMNGITYLCWNYPCAGYLPLVVADDHIAPRIGFGTQEFRGQFLATLAMSRVPAEYPARVGEDVRTVADLVEYEKLACREGIDQSMRLLGLAYYAMEEPEWTNDLGETWSLERLIQEELAQPVVTAACGGTNRLMGLSFAIYRRHLAEEPIIGQYSRAEKLVSDFQDYALTIQNSDGSWGPRMLATRSSARDQDTQLRSTGYILEWLVFSLPDERLDDPGVLRSINLLNRLLSSRRTAINARSSSSQEVAAHMHALHALSMYDNRFFKPRTPQKAAAPEPEEQAVR